jgi:hypothetical protein
MKQNTSPPLRIYFEVMELTISIQDLYRKKFNRKFKINYQELLDSINELITRLHTCADDVDAYYPKKARNTRYIETTCN